MSSSGHWTKYSIVEIPIWLKSLTGACQLLNPSQIEFIADVYFIIKHHNTRSAGKTSDARTREMKQIADGMKINLKLVVQKLQQLDSFSRQQQFEEEFREWYQSRDRNVRQLRKIASLIDTKKQDAQSRKVASSAISLIGGAICLLTGGAIGKMLGSTLVGFGGLSSVAVSVDEETSLGENIKQAENIVKLDMVKMKNLLKHLEEFCDMEKILDGFNSINLNENLKTAAENLQKIPKNSPRQQIEKKVQGILKSLNISEELKEEISDILGIFITIYMLIDRHVFYFKLGFQSKHILSKLNISADIFRAGYVAMNSVANLTNCSKLTKSQKQKVGKGMALDVLSILLVAFENPNSVEAENIRKIASELLEQAGQFKEMYEKALSTKI